MTDDNRNVERATKLDTATLSDALDKLGIAGQCYRIKPRSTDFRHGGPRLDAASTVRPRTRPARSATTSTTCRPARSSCSTTAGARTRLCGATS